MRLTDDELSNKTVAHDRDRVTELLAELSRIGWTTEGKVAYLVETPEPQRHVLRDAVEAVVGTGFSRDHKRKSFYRGRYSPGREVSAMTLEVLQILGIEPKVVGDNLITQGIDLGRIEEGVCVRVGEVELRRSNKAHRPCQTFRLRTSPEAFAAISRERYRGALFNVIRGGTIRKNDSIVVIEK